MEKIDKIVTGC